MMFLPTCFSGLGNRFYFSVSTLKLKSNMRCLLYQNQCIRSRWHDALFNIKQNPLVVVSFRYIIWHISTSQVKSLVNHFKKRWFITCFFAFGYQNTFSTLVSEMLSQYFPNIVIMPPYFVDCHLYGFPYAFMH